MNIKSLLLAAVAITLGLSACNKEQTLTQDGLPLNAVRITDSVGNPFATTRSNPFGTVEQQGEFNKDDRIIVYEFPSGEGAVYQFDGAQWEATNNKYLLWKNDVDYFDAGYPLYEDGSLRREVEFDQSTLDNIAKSDLMTGVIKETTKGEILNFEMQRQTARIIIKIADFSSEFPSDSKVKNVKFWGVKYNAGSGDTLQAEAFYECILIPQTVAADVFKVSLKVYGRSFSWTSSAEIKLHADTQYNLTLIVGRDVVTAGGFTATPWTEVDPQDIETE